MYGKLLRYNLRICASLGPWPIVVPVSATMLVLFAMMAMVSVLHSGRNVLVLEALGPILLAFVGASLLRPEYQFGTLETTLARPVSFRLILGIRMLVAGVAVLALVALLAVFSDTVMGLPVNVGLAILATAASMAFLATLTLAIAAAWRSPMLGFGVAAALWALDVIVGARLNPLLTLHGYGTALAYPEDMWDHWWVGKIILAALAVGLAVYASRAAVRPASQRVWSRLARAAVGVLVIALLYILSGALYKVWWGQKHEEVLLAKSRSWYQQAFSVYGSVPVVYLMGPSFAHFVGYRPPWTPLPQAQPGLTRERAYEQEQLKLVAFGPADNRWADNALWEYGRWSPGGGPNELGDGEDARLRLAALQTLAREHPTSPLAPLGLAKLFQSYRTLGRPDDAEACLRTLLQLYPSTKSAQDTGRAVLDEWLAAGRLEDAEWVAERLVRGATEETRPDALVSSATILVRLGRHDEARRVLEEAVRAADQGLAKAEQDTGTESVDRYRALLAARRRANEALSALPPGQP